MTFCTVFGPRLPRALLDSLHLDPARVATMAAAASQSAVATYGTDIDNTRLSKNNMDQQSYTIMPGVLPQDVEDLIEEKFTKSRLSSERRLFLAAAFNAVVKCWRKVVEERDTGANICESDAQMVRPIPYDLLNPELLNDSRGVIALGGIRRYKATDKGRDSQMLGNRDPGIHVFVTTTSDPKDTLPSWTNCAAYYIPPGQGKRLLRPHPRAPSLRAQTTGSRANASWLGSCGPNPSHLSRWGPTSLGPRRPAGARRPLGLQES